MGCPSNNPRTKSYRKRVERLGKKIDFYIGLRSLDDLIAEFDPEASEHLVAAALTWAIQDRRKTVEIWRESIRRDAETVEQLEQLLASRSRPALRLVGGQEAA